MLTLTNNLGVTQQIHIVLVFAIFLVNKNLLVSCNIILFIKNIRKHNCNDQVTHRFKNKLYCYKNRTANTKLIIEGQTGDLILRRKLYR